MREYLREKDSVKIRVRESGENSETETDRQTDRRSETELFSFWILTSCQLDVKKA